MIEGWKVSRRRFLNATAAAGVAVTTLKDVSARAAEPANPASGPTSPARPPARPQVQLLADLFLRWQMDIGRLDPGRTPACANWGPKRNSYLQWVVALNQAYRATGTEAYRIAADRVAVFHLACLCNTADFHPPHFGDGIAMYAELKRNHPLLLDFDDKAAALFAWMAPFRWNEPSYYRNGYPGGTMPDAGNSCDNAQVGGGLVAYYAVRKNADVLTAAEDLARYFVSECKPGTYQGVWSSNMGTWVVAPTTQDRFEHFQGVKSCEIAWGYTSIIAIDYLTRLATLTEKKDLRKRIAETCTASMKWQFDACQFDDGACGLSGRDDKWLGMTAGAVLSYLRVRDAGYVGREDVARYRPKAQAAADWLLANLSSENLQSPSPGYFPVHGKSLPKPPDNVSWMLAYTLQALLRLHDL